MSRLKSKLAVGFLMFLIIALAFLGTIAVGVVVDTGLIAVVLFIFNAGFHWCLGWTYVGLVKLLSISFGVALIVRAVKIARWVVN